MRNTSAIVLYPCPSLRRLNPGGRMPGFFLANPTARPSVTYRRKEMFAHDYFKIGKRQGVQTGIRPLHSEEWQSHLSEESESILLLGRGVGRIASCVLGSVLPASLFWLYFHHCC